MEGSSGEIMMETVIGDTAGGLFTVTGGGKRDGGEMDNEGKRWKIRGR